MDQDDILFGNPKWLENFKEMKQVAIDPLYKDCPKPWTVLRINLCWHFLTSPLEVVSSQQRCQEMLVGLLPHSGDAMGRRAVCLNDYRRIRKCTDIPL